MAETPLEYGERRARELGLTRAERAIQARLIGGMGSAIVRSSADQKLADWGDLTDGERRRIRQVERRDEEEARRRRWGIGAKRSERIRAQISPEKQATIDRVVSEQLPRLQSLGAFRATRQGGHSSLLADVTLVGSGIDPLEVERILERRPARRLG